MDHSDSRWRELFFEVQRGLPRQGPGNRDSTQKALALCRDLPHQPDVLDIGCGPGMQTLALAEASSGNVVAVDTSDEYLDELRQRVGKASLSHRVQVQHADMTALGFSPGAFDLIWSEGAAYIMGVPEALQAWRPLLRCGGYLAFSELVWLDEDPAAEVAEFFRREYPQMTSVPAIKELIGQSRFEPVGDFTLPDSAWWDDYYTPLATKLPLLRDKYPGDEEALDIIAASETEIDMRRRYGHSYGYHFFVARKVDELGGEA